MDPRFQLLLYVFISWSFIQLGLSVRNNIPDACNGHETVINNRACGIAMGTCSNVDEIGTKKLTSAQYRNTNCYCDDWCFVYGDCCEDKVKHKGLCFLLLKPIHSSFWLIW